MATSADGNQASTITQGAKQLGESGADSVTQSLSQTDPQPAAVTADMLAKIPLDETLYSLKPEEAAFFKQQTGIQDDGELKRHVLEVQKEAWDVCGRSFR